LPYGSTQRLRVIQSPAKGEALARSLLSQTVTAPFGACRVEHPSELPSPLQKIVRGLSRDAVVWVAYATRLSTHFYTAELNFDLSRDHGKPVLRLREYDERGRVVHSDLWVRTTDDQWTRCAA